VGKAKHLFVGIHGLHTEPISGLGWGFKWGSINTTMVWVWMFWERPMPSIIGLLRVPPTTTPPEIVFLEKHD